MFTRHQFSSLLTVLAMLVVFLLPQELVAAVVTSQASDGIVSAVTEGLLTLGAFSVLVFFISLRRQSKSKANRRFDNVGYECLEFQRAAPQVECTQEKAAAESIHSKKPSSKVPAEGLRKAAERTRLSGIVHNLARKGDVCNASNAMNMLEDTCGTAGLQEYSTLITMCCKTNDVEGAHLWIKRLQEKGIAPNATCFNNVIHAHVKQGNISKAIAVTADMREAGVDFDVVTYNTIIDAFTRKGDALEAQAWMKKMLAAGVNPSVVSFCSVMRACAKAGLNSELEHWIEEADELGIELNMICFSAVINAFAQNSDVDSAEYWLSRMAHCKVKPSVHCFTGVVEIVCRQGDVARATKIVDRMRESNLAPDLGIYNLLVKAACQVGKLVDAQNLINEAIREGIRIDRQTKSAWIAANLTIPSDANLGKPSCGTPSSDKVATAAHATFEVDQAEAQTCVGKRFVGTVKDFIASKFGYITCDETFAVFKRDIFLGNKDNPEQYAKGQKVSFVLQLDTHRGLPRACSVEMLQK